MKVGSTEVTGAGFCVISYILLGPVLCLDDCGVLWPVVGRMCMITP